MNILLRFFIVAGLMASVELFAQDGSSEEEFIGDYLTVEEAQDELEPYKNTFGVYSITLRFMDKCFCIKANYAQLTKIFALLGAATFCGLTLISIGSADYVTSHAANKAIASTITILVPFAFSMPWFLAAFVAALKSCEGEVPGEV